MCKVGCCTNIVRPSHYFWHCVIESQSKECLMDVRIYVHITKCILCNFISLPLACLISEYFSHSQLLSCSTWVPNYLSTVTNIHKALLNYSTTVTIAWNHLKIQQTYSMWPCYYAYFVRFTQLTMYLVFVEDLFMLNIFMHNIFYSTYLY